MSNHKKSKNRLVIRSSPDIHGERSTRSGKKKHDLSQEFETLFTKINNIREWTRNLIKDSIALVSVESEMNVKSYLNDSEKNHLGTTKLEALGMDMVNAANSLGVKGGSYEKALLKVGECEQRLGSYERDLVVDVCSSYIRPLKYFMEVELNKLSEEKEMLTSRKIDYDYHVRQATSGKPDKNTPHKLKMAEMALEFQYVHAKEILHDIEVSECQVGHLIDLVNVQSVYHQKCLAELEKLKIELKITDVDDLNDKGNQSEGSELKKSSSKTKRRAEKVVQPEPVVRPSCLKRLENQPVRPQESRVTEERYPKKIERNHVGTPVDSSEVEGEDARLENSAHVSVVRTGVNSTSVQLRDSHVVKCPVKARSSIIPSTEVRTTKLDRIPEDPRSRPNAKRSSPECSKHSKQYLPLKTDHKPVNNLPCHRYSGDHPGGVRKDDYSSDDSTTTSRETHVIPIPYRNNYRRDVGKMFFTPCHDLE